PGAAGDLAEPGVGLYRSARAGAFAGDTLRRGTRRRLRSRLGLGPEPPAGGTEPPAAGAEPPAAGPGGAEDALSSTVARLSGSSPEQVQRLLHGPGPATEEELIALGRELEELRRRVEGSWI